MKALVEWISRPTASTFLILGALALGWVVFVLRNLARGAFRDGEMESRGDTLLIGMTPRLYAAWLVQPLSKGLLRIDVPANAVTGLSILLAVGAGVALGAGRLTMGGWLFVAAGLCDFLDGRLARATKTASSRGAALDSVLDRYAEAAPLAGLCWFYRDSWVLVAGLLALSGSLIVPYVKARGESLGVEFKNVGVMQRTERVLAISAASVLSPVIAVAWHSPHAIPKHPLVAATLVVVAISTHATAAHRLAHLLASLKQAHTQVRPSLLGRGGLGRTVVASMIATGVDFITVASVVSMEWLSPAAATVLGCAVGGTINFGIHRFWSFHTRGGYVPQVARYAVVSGTTAVLSAGGVALAALLPALDYRVAWWLSRALVFLLWGHPLQRDYVFRHRAEPVSALASGVTPLSAVAQDRATKGTARSRRPVVPQRTTSERAL